MDVQAHMIVNGRVQGVGFRWFVAKEARLRGLTGWVKNLSGGQVEILAEGQRGLIETLIHDMKVGNRASRVTDIRLEWNSYSGRYKEFDITF